MKIILNILFLPLISQLILQSDGGSIGSPRVGPIPDKDLQDISELLLSSDVPNENRIVRAILQNRVSSSPSTKPLLQYKDNPLKKQPRTYTLLKRLFREYERNSPNVYRAKDDFLNAVMETYVMDSTINFLNSHGLPTSKTSWKNYLDQIWFTSYHRGKGIQSSGFKHVFMAELKENKYEVLEVKGLHNWIFFLEQEKLGTLKYIGWTKYHNFRGYQSSIVKIKFTWRDILKPTGSLFVGTSPELELALYSLCFVYRQQQDCKLSLGHVPVNITTHAFTVNGNNVIGSAYPTI